ncbi:ABC transporter permease [Corynebacterium timonense]|uniref:Putative ABC transport system permease protein n=1 Tax=Corynebacterium timonense TaxID=441500 RepID=A0A1H1MPM7_9CORY|nr:ABC transporter permease [Corynebacterium timonense]SDR88706.1 putative ABC transport system permease protein [Corynebacterium timonense]
MNLRESIKLAAASLNANKMRSLLTLLGIIIGIMAVIIIMTLGSGLQKQVLSSLEGVGAMSHIATVHPRDNGSEADPFGAVGPDVELEEQDMVSLDDLQELRDYFGPRVSGVDVPNALSLTAAALNGQKETSATVYPVLEDSFRMRNLQVEYGRPIGAEDVTGERPLTVVSPALVDDLFDGDPQGALGQRIDLNVGSQTAVFTIVGVLEERNDSAQFIGGQPLDAYVPLTATDRLGETMEYVDSFAVQSTGGEDPASFQQELQAYLDRWYQRNENFEITVLDLSAGLEELTNVFGIIAQVLASIGGISLLVGGIGVMNIMLITVTERTREIGVRKALGATNTDIRTQFIVEAMLVCLVGGIIGVVLGGAIGMIATASFDAFVYPPIGAVLFSLAFSLITGVFFGAYPASKAAKMQPIDALRYE